MTSKDNIESWLELESDPGLFSLLVEDFGVKGIEVEEIYDLNLPLENQTIYGFIFLFKWVEDKRTRRKTESLDIPYLVDQSKINSMFFAKQIVPNSCATHALISVIMNCPDISIGGYLEKLKNETYMYTPEDKGYAIAKTIELAQAHNKHAKWDKNVCCNTKNSLVLAPSPIQTTTGTNLNIIRPNGVPKLDTSVDANPATIDASPSPQAQHPAPSKSAVSAGTPSPRTAVLPKPSPTTPPPLHSPTPCSGTAVTSIPLDDDSSFHYVSFVPIDGTLYELDGLKPHPVNHGKWDDTQSWTDKFRIIISERINNSSSSQDPSTRDIRFNLLAVVADKRLFIKKKLISRKSELSSALESMPQVLKVLSAQTYQNLFDQNSFLRDSGGKDDSGMFKQGHNGRYALKRLRLTKGKVGGDICPSDGAGDNVLNRDQYVFTESMATTMDSRNCAHLRTLNATILERVRQKFFHYAQNSTSTTNTSVAGESVHFTLTEYIEFLKILNKETIMHEENLLKENEKWDCYRVDDARRTHDYTEFINTFITLLDENKLLGDLIQSNLMASNLKYANRVRRKVRRSTQVTTKKTHKLIK